MKNGQHYYVLRKAGNAPRFGWTALFIVIVLLVVAMFNSNKATVNEVYTERSYQVKPDGRIITAEYKKEVSYRVDIEERVMKTANSVPQQSTEVVEEVVALTKHYPESTYIKGAIMVHGEAGGVPSITRRSGCLWIVCNRVISEDPFFPDDLEAVIEQKSQFDGYTPGNTYTQADYDLAVDVFERFWREQNGESSVTVGRTIPTDYLYFTGDGKENHFTKVQYGTPYVWGSMFVSPYKN